MDDKLERILRHDARLALPDDGFSARVMAALPPQRASGGPAWLRPALVFGSATLGCVLAFVLAPGNATPLQAFADLLHARGMTMAAWTGIGVAGALAASGIVLAFEADA